MRRAVPLLAVLALLGGCSQPTDGSATPGGSGPTATGRTSASSEPTSASSEPAERPKAIDIKGVDPCSLVTDAQRAEVGLDRPPRLDEEAGNPGCSLSREDRKYSVGLYLNSTRGIEVYTDPPRPDATKTQVGGFPAVLLQSTTALGPACSVIIDVSDGQVVNVQAHSLGETDAKGLCQVSQPLADAVVTNLMAK